MSGQEKWKTVSRAFDNVGSPTLLTYPSGFMVGHTRDAIGRLKTMVDTLASANIACSPGKASVGFRA